MVIKTMKEIGEEFAGVGYIKYVENRMEEHYGKTMKEILENYQEVGYLKYVLDNMKKFEDEK